MVDSQSPLPANAPGSADEHRLRGNMGVFGLIFTVLAFNAPLAIMVAFAPVVIGYGNGLGAPVAYLIAGVIAGLFSVGFVRMARQVRNPGGFYSLVTLGLGRPLGLGASFLALCCYLATLMSIYSFPGTAMSSYFAGSGLDVIPWWAWAIGMQIAAGILGYLNVGVSAKVLEVLLVGEILAIAVYDVFVVFQGGHDGLHFDSFLPSNVFSGSIGIALLFAMLCMGGFEATVVFRDEVRNPDRTIPRATYIFIATVAIAFAGSTWALIQGIGQGDAVAMTAASPTGSFIESLQVYVGTVAVDVVKVLLCTSVVAAMIAVHNVLSRYLFNLGVDGVLPAALGRAHPRFASPARASVALSTVVFVLFVALVIFGGSPSIMYAKLLAVSGYAFLMLLLLTGVAVLVFTASHSSESASTGRFVLPVLAIVGLVITLYLATAHLEVLLAAGGVLVYVVLAGLYGAVVVGVGVALRLRTSRPDVYVRIGRQ